MHRALVIGLFVGIVCTFVGSLLTAGDHGLARLANRLHAEGVSTTAHGGQVWHECTQKRCTGSDHVRAEVQLPAGTRMVMLHGSNADTDGLRENHWSLASDATGYAGTVDVLYDPSDPANTVMATADVRAWVSGGNATAVRDDVIVTLSAVALALLCALGLLWRSGYRPWPLNGRALPRLLA